MIVITGDRGVLVRIFSGHLSLREDGQRVDDLQYLPPVEVSAVYSGDHMNQVVPDLLVVDTPNLREFFAWCSTYLPHWSPLSAGMHVVERRRLCEAPKPAWGECPRQLLRGLLCVALGELLFEWQLANGPALPSVLSLRSTFGYVATCAIIAHRACLSDLLSRWVRAQHLLQLNPRRVNSQTLKSVWAPLFAFVESSRGVEQPESVSAALADIIADDSHNSLFRHLSPPREARQRREDVVIALESFIRDTKLDNPSQCFEAAVIASRMSTSPMSHFDVLSDMANAEPRTLLWYSFLSGVFALEPASPIFETMLYKVERDLRDQPAARPDIVLDELEALIGPHGQLPSGIGIGAGFINVELERGVCASFRLRRESPQTYSQVSQVDDRQLFSDLLEQLRGLFERHVRVQKESVPHSQRSKARRRRNR